MRLQFYDYKFRCHSVGKLMVGANAGLTDKQEQMLSDYMARNQDPTGKPLTQNQLKVMGELLAKANAKPELSTGAKSFLHEIHKEQVFGMDRSIQSKYLDKGLQVESQALSLYSNVTGKFFATNKERKENDYFSGEADNTQGRIRDIKSSWSFETFPLHDKKLPNPLYEWQMQGYMDLYDLDSAEIIYVLVDTPDMLIEDEIRRTSWKMGMIEVPEELQEEIRHNMTYKHIPEELRVKSFYIKRDKKKIALMRQYVKMGRKYLNSLSESMADQLALLKKVA